MERGYDFTKYDETPVEPTTDVRDVRTRRGLFGTYFECTQCGGEADRRDSLEHVCSCDTE